MTREEAIVYFESLLKRFEEMHETKHPTGERYTLKQP